MKNILSNITLFAGAMVAVAGITGCPPSSDLVFSSGGGSSSTTTSSSDGGNTASGGAGGDMNTGGMTTGGTGGSTSTGGTTTSSTTTSGMCMSAGDCPGVDTTCSFRTCKDGVCGTEYAPTGTACTSSSGPGKCSGGNCAVTCNDGLLNGNETDVDCGVNGDGAAGDPTCDKCVVGKVCKLAGDCITGVCSNIQNGFGTCSN